MPFPNSGSGPSVVTEKQGASTLPIAQFITPTQLLTVFFSVDLILHRKWLAPISPTMAIYVQTSAGTYCLNPVLGPLSDQWHICFFEDRAPRLAVHVNHLGKSQDPLTRAKEILTQWSLASHLSSQWTTEMLTSPITRYSESFYVFTFTLANTIPRNLILNCEQEVASPPRDRVVVYRARPARGEESPSSPPS